MKNAELLGRTQDAEKEMCELKVVLDADNEREKELVVQLEAEQAEAKSESRLTWRTRRGRRWRSR
jgi:hypothetical protein